MYSATGQFDSVLGPDGEGPGLKPSAAVSANPAASPVTAAAPTAASSGYVNTNTAAGIAAASAAPAYKEPGKGAGMSFATPKSTPKPIDKSNWNRDIKVSQKVVDLVKSEGRGNMGSKPGAQSKLTPTSPEYKEAVKRVYPSAYNRSQVQYTPSTGPDRGNKRSSNTASSADAARQTALDRITLNPKAAAGQNPFPKLLP